jgi:hypothetical protein
MTIESEWTQELREVSAGCYRITLTDQGGRVRYSATGFDPETLTKGAEDWFSSLGRQGESTRR